MLLSALLAAATAIDAGFVVVVVPVSVVAAVATAIC